MEITRFFEFSFLCGTRGTDIESFYYGEGEVEAPIGTDATIEIWSKKGGVDRETITLE